MVSARFAPPGTRRRTAWSAHQLWSRSAAWRWAVRVAFALPLCALALWADRRGFAGNANRLMEERSLAVRDGGGDLSGIGNAYPPIPTFLAAVLPGGTAGVAVCTAFLAGVAMQLVISRLVRRHVVPLLLGFLVLSLIAVPALWFEGTQNLSGFLGLMFLVVAIDGFVRFVARGDTIGGFVAGLALAAAFLCDPIALVYTVALGVAAPFLMPRDQRREPGALRASACVLVFPTAAMAGAWAFLEWRFTGAVYTTIRADQQWFSFGDGVLHSIVDALEGTGRAMLRSPLYLTVGALLVLRRRAVAAGYAVPLAGLALAQWIGISYSEALAFALLTLVALYSLPRPSRRWEQYALAGAAAVQLGVGLAWDPAGQEYHRWAEVLFA